LLLLQFIIIFRKLGEEDPLRVRIVSLHEAAARYKSSLAEEDYAEEPSEYPVPVFDIDINICAQVTHPTHPLTKHQVLMMLIFISLHRLSHIATIFISPTM